MITDLDEYYEKIKYINKDVAVYEDDEGNYFNISPANLLASCLYQELDKEQLKQAVFNQNIPKDMIFPKKKTTKVVVKSEITHKPKDNTTLVDKEIEVNQVWAVSNGVGIKKVYNTQDEAMNKAKEINKKIFEVLGIENYKGVGIKKVYNTQSEAVEKAKEINKKILEVFGIENYKTE